MLIQKEPQHASGPFRVLHLLEPLPQRHERQPMGVRGPLPFQIGSTTKDVRVHFILVFKVETDHFVDERKRQIGELPGQHLRRVAVIIVMHNMVEPDTSPSQANLAGAIAAQKIRKDHLVLLLDFLHPIVAMLPAFVQRKEIVPGSRGSRLAFVAGLAVQ